MILQASGMLKQDEECTRIYPCVHLIKIIDRFSGKDGFRKMCVCIAVLFSRFWVCVWR